VKQYSNQAIENFLYDPISGVCMAVDMSYGPSVMFIPLLIFDIVVIILTVFKTIHLASMMQNESGAMIVCNFLSADTGLTPHLCL
jgi:hypothetical protein